MWHPVTGGANLPALNDALAPFGIGFSDQVYKGDIRIPRSTEKVYYASGTRGGGVYLSPVVLCASIEG